MPFLAALCLYMSIFETARADEGAFHLGELPIGSSVTLPRPALTMVSSNQTVNLTSTDMPQTISLTLADSSPAGELNVKIYDPQSEEVRQIKLKKGITGLYAFKQLSTIRLVPQEEKKQKGFQFVIESNKPLGIAR